MRMLLKFMSTPCAGSACWSMRIGLPSGSTRIRVPGPDVSVPAGYPDYADRSRNVATKSQEVRMGKYLFHGSFTAEGLRGIQKKGGTSRPKAVRELAESLGGRSEERRV